MERTEIKIKKSSIFLTKIDDNLFSIALRKIDKLTNEDYLTLINKFNEQVLEKNIEILSFDIPSYAERNTFLSNTILKNKTSKILFKKNK